jgi:hypothetical protein
MNLPISLLHKTSRHCCLSAVAWNQQAKLVRAADSRYTRAPRTLTLTLTWIYEEEQNGKPYREAASGF